MPMVGGRITYETLVDLPVYQQPKNGGLGGKLWQECMDDARLMVSVMCSETRRGQVRREMISALKDSAVDRDLEGCDLLELVYAFIIQKKRVEALCLQQEKEKEGGKGMGGRQAKLWPNTGAWNVVSKGIESFLRSVLTSDGGTREGVGLGRTMGRGRGRENTRGRSVKGVLSPAMIADLRERSDEPEGGAQNLNKAGALLSKQGSLLEKKEHVGACGDCCCCAGGDGGYEKDECEGPEMPCGWYCD
uniref:Uncharacterized protein n=1 Tax=Chromera velia CCMP2878 TaxID=1169474 RepID=A0A0G4GDT4_9ALVE|eukprot:Cvel_4565.t1-p1 / transcript=Cvel_4565.t1 / gene=Cvel_4565 / organism=Chromera_velia_CCMP2878 / gene_product=hypothetical protein / transcript_product=hypothetical protein / location=Cvel_scaffold200:61749-70402(+) / protein_length=246 / sequence_SO=supercontig / SO=protein_coding / is_pseudo=false